MALKSGFWNAVKDTDGNYDKKYNADDYSDALSFVVGNGIINTNSGTSMQVISPVISGSTYSVTVKAGYGWINGKWFKNPTDDNTTLVNITAPTQGRKRYDRIVVRRCSNIVGTNNRDFILTVIKGSETAETPTKPDLVRDETDYDICLADVLVSRGDSLTATLEDMRPSDAVCGWVNGYFGDNFNEYMSALEVAVDNKLDTLQARADDWVDNNSMTKTTIYRRTETVTTASTTFDIGIASYNSESDDLAIFVNGYQEFENDTWTRNGTTVTFIRQKDAGTKITFEVTKSLDGIGLNTASETIEQYQENLQNIDNFLETFNYTCNGSTDNVELCNWVNNFLKEDLADYSIKRIEIHGTFGMTSAVAGTGATNNAYKWFHFNNFTGTSNRKIILDFSNCSELNFPIADGTNNILFYCGASLINIQNINFLAQNTTTSTNIQGVYATGEVAFENCRGWVDCYEGLTFAKRGRYDNCRFSCTSRNGNCSIFYPSASDIVIVNGGEYYAYTVNGTYSTIAYHDTSSSGAVTILNSVRMPTASRSGYTQLNSIRINTGYINMTNCVSSLIATTSSNATSSIYGTIPLSK